MVIEVILRTLLNWRFYIGFPILLIHLLFVIVLELICIPSKFIYKKSKKLADWINYSDELRALQRWTFKK